MSTGAAPCSLTQALPFVKEGTPLAPSKASSVGIVADYGQGLIGASCSCFEGLNECTRGSATSCEECLLIHPKCAWCSKEVCGPGKWGSMWGGGKLGGGEEEGRKCSGGQQEVTAHKLIGGGKSECRIFPRARSREKWHFSNIGSLDRVLTVLILF